MGLFVSSPGLHPSQPGPREFDGEDLHNRIRPEFWCITKTDLRRLRQQVKKAVTEGRIVPTSEDPFEPTDTAVGPNIYTVTDQLIKPLTEPSGPSGGASYALTHHPDGMECEVFITHTWAEGIYEFIDKTLASWPRRKRSAYACMLSNPQHLDIACLVSDPLTSPFARALAHCTHMVAVPNGSVGIYSRAWCCYEAYLACVWGKEIFTAWTPLGAKATLKAAGGPCVAVVCCALLSKACTTDDMASSWAFYAGHGGSTGIGTIFLLLATSAMPGLIRTLLIYAGSVCWGIAAVLGIRLVWHPDTYVRHGFLEATWVSLPVSSTQFSVALMWALLLFAPMILAVDGARGALHKADLARLGLGYSGSIREVSCTIDSDKANILASIGDEVASVEHYISVLLKSGMSTGSMRKAASMGIAVEKLSFVQLGPPFCLWVAWTVLCLGILRPGVFQLESAADVASWQATQCIYPVMHLILVMMSPQDKRAFINYGTLHLLWWVIALDGLNQVLYNAPATHQPTAIAYNLLGMVSFVVSAVGLGRLVSVPLIGKHVARLIIGKATPIEVRISTRLARPASSQSSYSVTETKSAKSSVTSSVARSYSQDV